MTCLSYPDFLYHFLFLFRALSFQLSLPATQNTLILPFFLFPAWTLLPRSLRLASCGPHSSPSLLSSPSSPPNPLHSHLVLFSGVSLSLRTSQEKLREQGALFKQIKSHAQSVYIYSSRQAVTGDLKVKLTRWTSSTDKTEDLGQLQRAKPCSGFVLHCPVFL